MIFFFGISRLFLKIRTRFLTVGNLTDKEELNKDENEATKSYKVSISSPLVQRIEHVLKNFRQPVNWKE